MSKLYTFFTCIHPCSHQILISSSFRRRQCLIRETTCPSRLMSKGSKEHPKQLYLLGTTKAGVIKALPRRGDISSLLDSSQVFLYPFPENLPTFRRQQNLGKTTKRDGKISGGCGSNCNLCCLGSVYITSNRDQCNLVFK